MQIPMTVPIYVNGFVICEFDAAVDIKVTSYGYPAQTYGPPEHCDPGEGPEWEVEEVYVDVQERDEKGNIVSKLIKCPDELLTFMTQYIEGQEFGDMVSVVIGEDDTPDRYEPDYRD